MSASGRRVFTIAELAKQLDSPLPLVAVPTVLYSQDELASALDLSERQLRNLVKVGLPVRHEGRHPRYPWPLCMWWLREWRRLNGVDLRRSEKVLYELPVLIAQDRLNLDENPDDYVTIGRYLAESLVNAKIEVPQADLERLDPGA